MAKIYKLDSVGKPFRFSPIILDPSEYARIISEINTNYSLFENQEFCSHNSYDIGTGAYTYFFENHGYNDYNIIAKHPF